MKKFVFLSSVLAFLILGVSIFPIMAQEEARLERMVEQLNLTDSSKNKSDSNT